MSKKILNKFLVSLMLAFVVIFGTGAGCNNNKTSTPISTSDVTINNFAFNPKTISIGKDTVVTWTNNDTTAHQVESDGNLPELISGEIGPTETFVFTFDQVGTFNYHCKIHPNMTASVIVK